MTALPVEWVLVIYYGPAAHRATYGRLGGSTYTKDYIQLSKKDDFIHSVSGLFQVAASSAGSVQLEYKWPTGSAPGEFVFQSADRPHLKWETSLGAPKAWQMSLTPSDTSAETIPGNPAHLDSASADNEFKLLGGRGAGQPYLMAIKLHGEPRTLHLRAYLARPSNALAWADVQLLPQDIRDLISKTSQRSALAWSSFQSGGVAPSTALVDVMADITESDNPTSVINALDTDTGHALAAYLQNPGYGLLFDPTRNHDAWLQPAPLPAEIAASVDDLLKDLQTNFPLPPPGDAAAEALEVSSEEVEAFREQISNRNFEVVDAYATVKTRGSAQKAFAEAVKRNYGFRCAITGIETKDFLVASHIVPWSQDQTIRLDPSNGICLSLIMDRAFEHGYLLLADDLTVVMNWSKVGDDLALREYLEQYEGQKLNAPSHGAPGTEYLQRRRTEVTQNAQHPYRMRE